MNEYPKLHSGSQARGPGLTKGIALTGLALILAPCLVTARGVQPVSPSLTDFDCVAQNDKDALVQGKPIERDMRGAEVHSYRITLNSDQYLSVVVDQRGIDVVVTLFAPDGKKLIEVDSPNGTMGPEPVSIIAQSSGSYRLEVRSLEKEAKPGRYEVKITDLRTATEQDRRRNSAQQAFAEAERLSAQRTAESLRKAIDKYAEALLLWREVGDQAGQANTLNNLAVAHYMLGEIKKALEYLQQALPLTRAVGNRAGEGETLTNIGYMYDSLGEKQKALESYNQSLPILRATGNRQGEAATLNNIGMVYDSLGEKQKALDYYSEVLPLARTVGDRAGEAGTLSNIGKVYRDLGDNRKALEYFNQTLQIQRAIGNHAGEAITLSNIGVTLHEMGETQAALDHYAQALPLSRTAGDRDTEANTLINLGAVYSELGESRKALDYYNQALPVLHDVGNRRGEALARINIGKVYADLGEKQKALDYYNQALPVLRDVGDRALQGRALNNIGGTYADLGQQQQALDYYGQALSLFQAIGDRREEANTLTNIGEVYRKLGDNQKALDYFNQSLPIRRAVEDRNREAITLLGIARVERDRNNLVEARKTIEAALAIIESLRTKIASEQLRASYFASVRQFYDLYIDLLMRLHKLNPSEGHDALALQTSERARARSLLDLLIESRADIREGVDPQLLDRERSLQQLLNAKAERQLRLLGGKHTDAAAEAATKELEMLTTEYQQVESQIRTKSPRYAALTQPQPLTLREIQTQLLDPGTLLLEYELGDEHSYLWAVTQNSIASYELPKRVEIEEVARRLYDQLTSRNRPAANEAANQRGLGIVAADVSLADEANRLSRIVLAPVAAQLGKKRLVIVADGALQYVPFGALPAPTVQRTQSGPPLIVNHEIVNLPSASTLAVLRRESTGRQPAMKSVVVLADPVFNAQDERIKKNASGATDTGAKTESVSERRGLGLAVEKSAQESGLTDAALRIPRLPGTRREAQAILALAPGLGSKQALDFDASRATAFSSDLGQYRYVHFATHGLLNSVHPELSGIVLSMVDERGDAADGFLRAHEVFNLHLRADLVVLSACQTGLGKEVRGEGLIGLTRGFMYAGAPRVVVSLWSVSDVATAELMERFYRGMLVNKLSPAAALRAAQVAMWKKKRWTSPFYWAAFTLQGEWR
jgi:CHAT domain-containing protein/Flp pilus assembly protein TadD